LARRNLRVAVLDAKELMQEASWAAAGMLSPAPDSPAAIPLRRWDEPVSRSIQISSLPSRKLRTFRTGYRTGGALEVLSHGDAERESARWSRSIMGWVSPVSPLH